MPFSGTRLTGDLLGAACARCLTDLGVRVVKRGQTWSDPYFGSSHADEPGDSLKGGGRNRASTLLRPLHTTRTPDRLSTRLRRAFHGSHQLVQTHPVQLIAGEWSPLRWPLSMKNPPYPGHFIKDACLDPLGLTMTEGAKVLDVARHTLSRVVNGQSGISPVYDIRRGSKAPRGRTKVRRPAEACPTIKCTNSRAGLKSPARTGGPPHWWTRRFALN